MSKISGMLLHLSNVAGGSDTMYTVCYSYFRVQKYLDTELELVPDHKGHDLNERSCGSGRQFQPLGLSVWWLWKHWQTGWAANVLWVKFIPIKKEKKKLYSLKPDMLRLPFGCTFIDTMEMVLTIIWQPSLLAILEVTTRGRYIPTMPVHSAGDDDTLVGQHVEQLE